MGRLAAELSPLFYGHVTRELRRSDRVPVNCRLTYSGLWGNLLIVGEGTAIDLSKEGVGIHGNQAVEPGMLLTLCLDLPDYDGPLMIDEVRVMWCHGERFGVESVRMDTRSRLRLDHFLLCKTLTPPDGDARLKLKIRL